MTQNTEEDVFNISQSEMEFEIQLESEPEEKKFKSQVFLKKKKPALKKEKPQEFSENSQEVIVQKKTFSSASLEFEKQVLKNPKPIYPRISRMKAEEGDVELKIQIAKTGQIIKIQITKSSAFERLNRAAVTGAKKWKFKPNSKSYSLRKTIKFRLQP